jgi:hypothetical protein
MELTADQKELIRDFETVKLGIKSLEAKEKEMKPLIWNLLEPDVKIQLTQGKLYLKPMPKWNFSPAVTELEEEVKTLKAEEKASGTAEMVQNYVVEYREDKKEGFEGE